MPTRERSDSNTPSSSQASAFLSEPLPVSCFSGKSRDPDSLLTEVTKRRRALRKRGCEAHLQAIDSKTTVQNRAILKFDLQIDFIVVVDVDRLASQSDVINQIHDAVTEGSPRSRLVVRAE
jgi:hypothetical protein